MIRLPNLWGGTNNTNHELILLRQREGQTNRGGHICIPGRRSRLFVAGAALRNEERNIFGLVICVRGGATILASWCGVQAFLENFQD